MLRWRSSVLAFFLWQSCASLSPHSSSVSPTSCIASRFPALNTLRGSALILKMSLLHSSGDTLVVEQCIYNGKNRSFPLIPHNSRSIFSALFAHLLAGFTGPIAAQSVISLWSRKLQSIPRKVWRLPFSLMYLIFPFKNEISCLAASPSQSHSIGWPHHTR